MSASSLLLAMFRHKAWINAQLFDDIATVDASSREKELHVALRILNHVYVVDRIFAAHLCGKPHPYTATTTTDTPGVAELQRAVRESDDWYVGYVASLPAEALAERVAFTFTDGKRGEMTREEMLAHVATHGSYHRGGVGRVLAPLASGSRDIFTAYLHAAEPARRGSVSPSHAAP